MSALPDGAVVPEIRLRLGFKVDGVVKLMSVTEATTSSSAAVNASASVFAWQLLFQREAAVYAGSSGGDDLTRLGADEFGGTAVVDTFPCTTTTAYFARRRTRRLYCNLHRNYRCQCRQPHRVWHCRPPTRMIRVGRRATHRADIVETSSRHREGFVWRRRKQRWRCLLDRPERRNHQNGSFHLGPAPVTQMMQWVHIGGSLLVHARCVLRHGGYRGERTTQSRGQERSRYRQSRSRTCAVSTRCSRAIDSKSAEEHLTVRKLSCRPLVDDLHVYMRWTWLLGWESPL